MRITQHSTSKCSRHGQLEASVHLRWHTPVEQQCSARRAGLSSSRRRHRRGTADASSAQAPHSSPVLDTPRAPAPPLHPLLQEAIPKGYRCPICFGSEHSRSLIAEHVVRAACKLSSTLLGHEAFMTA